MSKNEEFEFVIYETTVENCDGCYHLVVAAFSPKEAAQLFLKDLKSEKWKKIAEEEFRAALDDWEALSEEERADRPTLPYYIYGWMVEVEGERYRTLKPITDAHIGIWDETSDSPSLMPRRIERHQIEQSRIVQIVAGSGNLVRHHRRYNFGSPE
jgi:hypothetical protein